jgi:hypothetical protein
MIQAVDDHELRAVLPADEAGTVVWVGAPGVVLPAAVLAAERVQRWVLVNGDRSTALRQGAATRGMPGVEVRHQVLGAVAGPASWHRSSVPGHGGVAPAAESVRNRYARFTETVETPVEAQAVSDFLSTLRSTRDPARPNGLVLAAPSDAPELLASLDDAALRSFDWIAVRGGVQLPEALEGAWCACTTAASARWLMCRRDEGKAALGRRLEQLRKEEASLRQRIEEEHRQAAAKEASLRQRIEEGNRKTAAMQDRLARAEAKLDLLRSWALSGDAS